jgi:NAD(P)-dependent dehydrogenase (short-subunit alcohol dehydrogenase family)
VKNKIIDIKITTGGFLMNFQKKTAVITGGANGIGRCIAEHFLDKDAFAAIIDTDAAHGAHMQEKYGNKLLFFCGDVGDEKTLDIFVETVLSRFPKVHYLINNAMRSQGGILSGCNYKDFEYALRVGVTAPYYLTMKLKENFAPAAAIVNISSSRSSQSQPDTESYTAAKGGISALTHALSASLAGIARVNAISPGWIDTSSWYDGVSKAQHSVSDKLQHPVHRVGQAWDIAKLTLFLCSEEAGFINGQEIFADGGMSKLMIYHGDYGWVHNIKND